MIECVQYSNWEYWKISIFQPNFFLLLQPPIPHPIILLDEEDEDDDDDGTFISVLCHWIWHDDSFLFSAEDENEDVVEDEEDDDDEVEQDEENGKRPRAMKKYNVDHSISRCYWELETAVDFDFMCVFVAEEAVNDVIQSAEVGSRGLKRAHSEEEEDEVEDDDDDNDIEEIEGWHQFLCGI